MSLGAQVIVINDSSAAVRAHRQRRGYRGCGCHGRRARPVRIAGWMRTIGGQIGRVTWGCVRRRDRSRWADAYVDGDIGHVDGSGNATVGRVSADSWGLCRTPKHRRGGRVGRGTARRRPSRATAPLSRPPRHRRPPEHRRRSAYRSGRECPGAGRQRRAGRRRIRRAPNAAPPSATLAASAWAFASAAVCDTTSMFWRAAMSPSAVASTVGV